MTQMALTPPISPKSSKNPVPSNLKTGKLFLQQCLFIVEIVSIHLVEFRKSVAIHLKVVISEKNNEQYFIANP